MVAPPSVSQSLFMLGTVHRSRLLVTLVAAATLVACSGDDDDAAGTADSGEAATGDDASTATVGTGTAAPGVEAFCTAEVAVEAAAAIDDEAALQDALDTLAAEAPSNLDETVASIVAGAEADEPLGEAYTELIEFMRDNCGFNVLAFTVADTSFSGVPAQVPAGSAIFTIDNTSDVEQAILIARINDDVTEPATELARLPAAEAFERMVVQLSLGVAPGATAYRTAELDPGRYFAAAILPEGTTPGGSTTTSPSTAGSDPTTAAPTGETFGIVKEFTVS